MREHPLEVNELDIDQAFELTDEDILEAMQHMTGYLDISTEDFRAIYHLAWRHAVRRLRQLQQTREA